MKTHYKKLVNPDYMGAYSLDNGDNGYIELNAVLKYVKQQEISNPQGKMSTELVGITDLPKPFILNRTAQKVLVRLSKSRYIEDWKNIPICFYVETGVKAFGDVVDALRIKQQQPKKINLAPFEKMITECKSVEDLVKVWNLPNFPQTQLFNLKEQKKNELSKN
jgi:hypothetical protein